MRVEQSVALARTEQAHGRVKRLSEGDGVADAILCQCVTDTRVYRCVRCGMVMSIEPTGEVEVWEWVVDDDSA